LRSAIIAGMGPRTLLESLRGETRVGTFGFAGGSTECDPDRPEEGLSHGKSGCLGPIIDITDQGASLPGSKAVRSPRARRHAATA
jgi:hypothetical protein